MGSCHQKERQERYLPAFLFDDHEDSELLKSIMRRVVDSGRHPVPDVHTAPCRDLVRYQDT